MIFSYDLLINYISAYVRLRWRKLALWSLLSLPVSLLIARETEYSYVVSEKVFVSVNQAPALSNMMGGSGGMGSFFGPSERETALSEQLILATSMPVFEAVRSLDPKLAGQDPNSSGYKANVTRMKRSLQIAAFGQEYVSNKESFSNEAFIRFKSSAKVESDSETGSLSISYVHSDPLVGFRMVKAIVESLKDLNRKVAADRNNARLQFLESQIAEVRRNVDSRSEAIVAHINATNVSGEVSTAVEQSYKMLGEVIDQIGKASIEINQRSLVLGESRKLSTTLGTRLKSEITRDADGQISTMTEELRRFQTAVQRYGDADASSEKGFLSEQALKLRQRIQDELQGRETLMATPDLQKLLASVESTIVAEEQGLLAAKQRLADLRKLRKEYEAVTSKIPGAQAGLSKLKLDYEQRLKVLEALTMQYLQAQIEKDNGSSQLFVIEEPMLSSEKNLGKASLLLISVTLLSTLIVLISGLQSFLRRTILLRTQLSSIKQPQYVGVVPHVPKLSMRNPVAAFRETGVTFKLAGALNRITAKQRKPGHALRIAVTSTNPAVGKTVATMGIFEGLRSRGNRCLVVDADFYASVRGLSQVAAVHGQSALPTLADLADALLMAVPVDTAHGVFVRAANIPQGDPELVQKVAADVPKLIESVSSKFDWIIFDCGPSFFTSTAVMLEHADVIILCCAEGKTSMKEVEAFCLAIENIKPTEAQILSILTNAKLVGNQEVARDSDLGAYYQKSKAA